MALTEKKIDILEAYLNVKCKDRVAAVKEIDPTIKHPRVYAYKLFKEPEAKEYINNRRRELLLESGVELQVIVKATAKNLYGSLGLTDRTILAHGKSGFDIITGKYSDSADAKNYWGILKDILGPEIATVIASVEAREDRKLDQKETEITHKIKTDKERLDLEKSRAGNLEDKEAQVFFTGADNLED